MKTLHLSLVLLIALTPATGTIRADEAETTTVQLKDLKLKVPASWKQVPSSSSMRLATFEIAAAEGDEEPGELTLFNFPGGGGGVAQNIDRWVGQFQSEGRKSMLKQAEVEGIKYYIADVSGTFKKSVGPPIRRQTVDKEGYRMLGAIVVLQSGDVYFLKLTGPEKTIAAQDKAFRTSFGGDMEKETDYSL